MLRPITPESAFITDWRSRVENLLTYRLPTCPDTLKKMGLPIKIKNSGCWGNGEERPSPSSARSTHRQVCFHAANSAGLWNLLWHGARCGAISRIAP